MSDTQSFDRQRHQCRAAANTQRKSIADPLQKIGRHRATPNARSPIYQVNHSLRFVQSRKPNLGARDLLLNSLQTAAGAASMIPTAS